MSENNEGGLADRSAGRTGGISGSGQSSGSNSSYQGGQNFGSAYGSSPGIGTMGVGIGLGRVRPSDMTLQDRQYSAAMGQGFSGWGSNKERGEGSSGVGTGTIGSTPVTYQTVKRRNKKTGVLETVTIPMPRPKPPSPNFPATGPIPKPSYVSYQDWVENLPASQPPREDYGTWTGANWPSAWGPDTNWGGISTENYNEPTGLGAGIKDRSQRSDQPDWGNQRGSPAGRQFGGPVSPGQQYTVGENGPETLRMNATGGGQVIPRNPADIARPTALNNQPLGGMDPAVMRQLFQMLQQRVQNRPQGTPGGGGWQQGMPMPPQTAQPPRPAFGGGWNQGMTPPTNRPTPPPRPAFGGGFGLSGLGQPGVLGQLRNRGGYAAG